MSRAEYTRGVQITSHRARVVVLPAFGAHNKRWVPTDDHVLDHLVRSRELADELESECRPTAFTVAVLDELPKCDHCGTRARYDTSWISQRDEGMAYACAQCLRWYGDPWIGLGHSTYLMTLTEVPAQLRRIIEDLCDHRGTLSPCSDPD